MWNKWQFCSFMSSPWFLARKCFTAEIPRIQIFIHKLNSRINPDIFVLFLYLLYLLADSLLFFFNNLNFLFLFYFIYFGCVLVAAGGLLCCRLLVAACTSLVVACEFLVAARMWDLIPWPGIEPQSPALEGGFLTTAPPGKSLNPFK